MYSTREWFSTFGASKLALTVAFLAMGTLVSTSSASAQTTINWNGGTAKWDNVLDWTPNGTPNSNADIVNIGSTSSGNVTLDINATIGELTLNSGNTLQFNPSMTLTVQNGTGTNGAVTINSGGTLDLQTGRGALTATGILSNGGQVNLGSNSVPITTPVTVTAGELNNTGTINLIGNITPSPSIPATLDITAAAFNSGIPTQVYPAVNSGTVTLTTDGVLTINGNYGNLSTTNVDSSGVGGSSLTIVGVLGNTGASVDVGPGAVSMLGAGNGILNFGNSTITHATEISAAGLNNFGTLNIVGSATVQTLVDLTGPQSADPFLQPPAILDAGTYNLTNDAELEYTGPGINGIGVGVTVNLNGAKASIVATNLTANTSSGTNSALNTLAGNAGTFELSNGASVSTNSGLNFINMGTVDVDQTQAGGSSFIVGGTLQNSPTQTLNFGNSAITKATAVTAAGLSNYGTLNIVGSPTVQTLVDLTGAASSNPFVTSTGALGSGAYNLTNDAELEYSGPGISSIGTGVILNLNGAGASIVATNIGSGANSALNTLASNTGTFEMSNGVSVTTVGTSLTNGSQIQVDQSGTGGSSLTIGGALTDAYSGTISIGNSNIKTATTVTVNGPLTTYGNSDLGSSGVIPSGNSIINVTGATSVLATLNVAGAAPSVLVGNYTVSGDALLEFASGGITAISGTSTESSGTDSLTLSGPNARVAFAGSTATSSALTGLASNGGSLTLQNGAKLTTIGVNFVNAGAVSVDTGGSGGSTLTLGGTITTATESSIGIGNTGLGSSTTVSASGFALNTLMGELSVSGQNPGSGPNTAALILANGITSIGGSNTILDLSNSNSFIALAGSSTLSNNGLSGLTSNSGTVTLDDGSKISTNAGLNFSNDGSITVDAAPLSSGSSSLSIGGILNNDDSLEISNAGTTGTSTAAVSATGLSNTGTISLLGESATHTATLTLSGNVNTSGNINVGDPDVGFGGNFATLTVNGGGTYTQNAGLNGGTTTITGTLTASTININSGVIQGAGTVNGNVFNQQGAVEGGISTTPAGLAINGNFVQSGPGVDYQVVNGISNGQFSSLNVNGNAGLSGLLNITTGSGFTFTKGQSFDILNITSTTGLVSGSFSGLVYNGQVASGSVLNIGGGLALDLTYNGNDVVLTVGTFTPSATADIWNAGSGIWNATNTSNWSGGAIPTSASDVTIGNSTGGTVTLDASVNPATINSLSVANGYTLSFGAANESLTTTTNANISAGGEIDIENSGDTMTTGQGGINGNLNNFGTMTLANGGALTVGGGGIFTNAGTLNVQNGATIAVAGDFINGLPGNAGTRGTATFDASGASTIGGNLVNNASGTLDIDSGFTSGSVLTVSGTLINAGILNIGNPQMTSPTTVNAGSFINTGDLTIEGSSTQFLAPANELSLLNITGSWIPSSGALDSGFISLVGDAQIQYAGPGISSIGSGTSISLDGVNASISNGSGLNSAFSTLTNIASGGNLQLSNGAQITTNPGLNLTNNGVLGVDVNSSPGTAALTVGGVLINNGNLSVGGNAAAPTTVNVAGLINNGQVGISFGSIETDTTGTPSVLDITGGPGSFVPASGALTQGSYSLLGDAVLEYDGPGITSLGTGVTVSLFTPGASISLAPLTDTPPNSALATLTSNAGILLLANGASVTTNAGLNLTNTAIIQLLTEGQGVGTTSLNVGGTLINSGSIAVEGGTGSGATLTAAGLSNNGTLFIEGSLTTAALVDITGVAATNPFVSASGVLSPGIYEIDGTNALANDAELEYTGPGITSIPVGASLDIFGANASITATNLPSGTNNALNTLSSLGGALIIDGTNATTTGGLVNTGTLELGGTLVSSPTSLTIAGTFVNNSTTNLPCGGVCVTANSTLTAAGLANNGTISVEGAEFDAPNTGATISVSGTASNSGTINIEAGGQFSATGSFTNAGTGVFNLGGGNGLSTGATSSFSSAGFSNSGTVNIGNAPTDVGNMTVTGSGNSYAQSGALSITTINGTLTSPTVNINGGLLRGNGIINGNVANGATVAATTTSNSAAPGTPGILTVNGNYSQTSVGVLDEFVQGTPVNRGTNFSAINVSGSTQLSGVLDVTTLNSYAFAAGQMYDILNFAPGQLSGTFTSIEYNNLAATGTGTASNPLNIGSGLALAVVYENSSGEVVLEVETAQGPVAVDNWIGSSDVWSNNVEWSTGASPTSTQSVVVGIGTTGGTVTYNVPNSTIDNLTVQPGGVGGGTFYTLAFNPDTTLTVTGTVTNSATIQVGASGAVLTSAGDINNAGELGLANGGAVIVGSTSAPADVINQGRIDVDSGSFGIKSSGGSSLTISGNLYNAQSVTAGIVGYGSVLVGNDDITSQSTLSAASLSTMNGTTTLANTLNGTVLINGENPGLGSAQAVLQLGTSITSIGANGGLDLVNGNSFITTDTSNFTNDGISALTSNAGVLSLTAGASATITGDLANAVSATIELQTEYFNDNPLVDNYGDIATTLNVGGLNNSGQVSISGCTTTGCTAQALLNVTGPVGSFAPGGALTTGNYVLSGNAELKYTGPGITSIASGVILDLTGADTSIETTSFAPNNGSTNSAFNTLTSNAGNLNLDGGASLATNVGLNLTNTGFITIGSDNVTIGGTLINNSGSTAGDAGIEFEGGALTAAGLINTGFIEAGFGNLGTFAINGTANNSGTIWIAGTGAQVTGPFTNSSGSDLEVGGATVQGEFESLGSGSISGGGFTNGGMVNIYSGTGYSGALTVTGSSNSYTQSGSSASTLVEGVLTAPTVNINGGLLQGNGLINGAVTNAATVAAATGTTTPGLLTIDGSYTQTSAGALNELIQGVTTRGTSYGALNVTGPASLAGALNITAGTGFAFAADQSFDIMNMTPNQLSGTFDTFTFGTKSTSGTGLLQLGGNLALALAYDGSNGEVLLDVVTPDNWTSGSGNWTSAANWSIGLPGPTQLVDIGTGAGGKVTLNESADIFNLTVQPGTSSGYTLAFNSEAVLTTAGTVDIAQGAEIDVEANGATLNTGGDLTNAGTLHVENEGQVNVGTALEPRNVDNTGSILVDSEFESGGSTVNISGTLSNAGGQITIGNSGIGLASTLSAGGFASNTLDGTVQVLGNASGATATLQLQKGITSIAANSSLLLLNSNSLVNLTSGGTNSALTGLTSVAGALQLESGSAISTTGALNIASTGSVGVDESSSTVGGSNLTVGGAITNSGTFQIGTGSSNPAIASVVSATSFNNSGTTSIGGSTLATGAAFTISGAAVNSGAVNIAGHGQITVTGGNSYTQSGVASSTTISNGASLTVGSYAQSGGITTVGTGGFLGGNLNASGGVSLTGGTLQGSGTINANVSNISGTLQATPDGVSAGTLTINASYSQAAGGTLGELIGGTTAGSQYSVLNVKGVTTLGGALDISTLGSFTLSTGQTYNIIDSTGTLSGTFSTLEFGQCPGPNCIVATSGDPLVIGGVAVLANYEDSQGVVQLDVVAPPPLNVSWQGPVGVWSDAAQWSDEALPLSFQNITIGSGSGGTVTFNQASASINSLTVEAGTNSNYVLSFAASNAMSVANAVNINLGGEIDVAANGASLTTGGNLNNAGTLTVSNGGTVTVGSVSVPASLTNSGSLAMVGGTGLTTTLTVNGNATNSGVVNIGSLATMVVAGVGNSYTQNNDPFASTTVNGTLTAPTLNINTGLLQGNGTINGNVVNGSAVAGGTYFTITPGVLTINGSYTQTAAGFLEESIIGTGTAGVNFSALNVSGAVTLAGTLQVNAASGFTLAAGESFDILNFTPNMLSGAFATVDFGSLSGSGNGVISIGNNLDLAVEYNNAAGDLVLEVGTLDTWNGTTDVWTGANDATNWSTGSKPTGAEDVLVGGGAGGTVTYNEASDTVLSLTVQPGTTSAYKLAFGSNDVLAVTNTVSIDTGAEIEVNASGASLTSGGALSNAGTLMLGKGGSVSVGTVASAANLTNTGTINVDPASTPSMGVTPPTGGSSLIISGEINNTGGTLNIGNTGISSQATVSAASFVTITGTGATATTSTKTLDGTVTITGQDPSKGTTAAVLELGTGITKIAATGSLTLANSNSFITTNTTGPFSNNALSGLASNAGTLSLDGGAKVSLTGNLSNSGQLSLADGSSMAIGTTAVANLTNTDQISVDAGTSTGGSTLSVNGTLDSTGGFIHIGNSGITSSATLSAVGFASNTLDGKIGITGSSKAGGSAAALVLNNGINTIAANAFLVLENSNSFVNLSAGEGNNSALSGLANVAGTVDLEGGASVTTSGALAIAGGGSVAIDLLGGSGGSNLTMTGALNNNGSFTLGTNASATVASTASAVGFNNSGGVTIGGSAGGATFTESVGATNSGEVNIENGGTFKVTSGNPYTQSGGTSSTTITAGGTFSAASYIQNGGVTTIGLAVGGGSLIASSGVTLNGGTLQGNGGTITGNVTNLGGTLQGSPDGVNPGTLTINGSFTNTGTNAFVGEIIGGTSSGQFSVLNITGAGNTLTLGGALDISTLAGFSFKAGETFNIIDSPANALGTFGTIAYNGFTAPGNGPLDISSDLDLAVNYTGTPGVVQLVVGSISTTDIWNGASDLWTNGNNDTTNWSLGAAPTVTANPLTGQNVTQDTIIGGGPGGTVTLNVTTEVKTLAVESSSEPYILSISGPNTLTVDKTLTIDQGGEIDVSSSGSSATLTSGGNASIAGTLTLTNGGTVTVGTTSAPTNLVNYITPDENQGNVGPTVGGTINVDATGTGGSTLTITGTITNKNAVDGTVGTINIGNSGIIEDATLNAQDFATSGTLDGTIKITGPSAESDAEASLTLGKAVTTIASTGTLILSGDNGYVELSSKVGSNSALTTLASNAGTLEVDNITDATSGLTTNGDSNGLFTNTGTIKASGMSFNSEAYNITVAGSMGMTNSGTIQIGGDPTKPVGDGSLQVTKGEFVQTSGGTTTVAGTQGNLSRLQADATATSGDVGMDIQGGSTLNIMDFGAVCVGAKACQSTGTNRNLTNEGTINISENGALNVSGDVNNSGTISANGTVVTSGNVNNAGQITIGGNWDPINYTQTAGSTVVTGTLIAGTINIEGGTFSSSGTVTGGMVNSSTLTPMSGPQTPGTMSISGSYTQTSTGILDELIAGSAASGEYGQLIVSGTPGSAALDGTLDVLTDSFTNGFTFGPSDTYDDLLMASGGISGMFSTLEFDCPGPNCVMGSAAEIAGTDLSAALLIDGGSLSLDLIYGNGTVDLQVTENSSTTPTPEPSTLLMLTLGLLALTWAMRRKMKLNA